MPITVSISHFLVLSVILFSIGVFGILINKKSIINILISIELMLLSANLNFVSFSAFNNLVSGHVFVIFVLTVAAAELAIGLAILIIHYRQTGSIAMSSLNQINDVKTQSQEI